MVWGWSADGLDACMGGGLEKGFGARRKVVLGRIQGCSEQVYVRMVVRRFSWLEYEQAPCSGKKKGSEIYIYIKKRVNIKSQCC